MSSEELSKSTMESIRDVILSRFKSRFTGAFIIAWIVWNWKIIYITIFIHKSEIDSNKIDYIGKHYTDSWHLLWLPLIASLLAILLIPILNGLSDNWHELISGVIKRISMWISKRVPVDQSEFEKLVNRYDVLETNYLTEIDRIKTEAKDDNERLSNIIVELNNELNTLKTEPKDKKQKQEEVLVKKATSEMTQEERKRLLSRLSLQLKTDTKSLIDSIVTQLNFSEKDQDEAEGVLIESLDKLKSDLRIRIEKYPGLETTGILKSLLAAVNKIEDNKTTIMSSAKKYFTSHKSLLANEIKNSFQPLYELLDAISEKNDEK